MRLTGNFYWKNTDKEEMLNCAVQWLSPRTLRLFTVECFRQIWDLIPEGSCRVAVEAAEGFADGHVSAKKLALAHRDARAFYKILNDLQRASQLTDASYWAGIGCKYVAAPDPYFPKEGAKRAAEYARHSASRALKEAYFRDSQASPATPSDDRLPEEHTPGRVPLEPAGREVRSNTADYLQADFTVELVEAEVLSDMLAHPTLPCGIDPAWLTWNNGTIGKLAEAI